MEVSLRSCGVGINFRGPKETLDRILDEKNLLTIANHSIEEPIKNAPRITIHENENFKLYERYPVYTYYGNSMEDAFRVGKYMLERTLQENGVYSIYSTTAKKNGMAVVLFGDTNSGKTTLGRKLVKDYGFRFVSDSKTTIDKNLNVIEDINYTDFKNTNLSRKPCTANVFVYPIITNFNEGVTDWTGKNKALYELNRQFNIIMRGVVKTIDNYSYTLKCLDTKKMSLDRAKFVKKLCQNSNVLKIRGSQDFICKSIASYL